MGIRFEYNPLVAGGMAGYAAGRGKYRDRQQKYALAAMQDQRRTALRYGGRRIGTAWRPGLKLGPGAAVGGLAMGPGAVPLEAERGTLEDPLEEAKRLAIGSKEEGKKIEAQRESNARRRRLGKPIKYPKAEPTYTPGRTQDEIDRDQKEADADLDWRRSQIDTRIPEIREDLTGTETGRKLAKLNQAERELRGGRDFDKNDEETQKTLEEIREERRRIMEEEAPPAPDTWEGLKDRSRIWDDNIGDYVKPGPGQKPTHYINDKGEPIPWQQSAEEVAAAEEQKKREEAEQGRVEKEEEAQKAAEEKRQAQEDKAEDRIWELVTEEGGRYENKLEEATRFVRSAMGLDKPAGGAAVAPGRAGFGIPDTPAAVAPVPGIGPDDLVSPVPAAEDLEVPTGIGPAANPAARDMDRAIARRRELETRALPPGVPAGSRWIDDNTILLPDGRRIERE